ncbi:RNA polymerase sigma factor [Flavihumibacter sp. UBA7668]|uniref:RNA polymerase sigma factor n=1 Tax=Flavihumibacter sp. UBA7668 TaxID=1946542 RepID=UPI0025C28D00|nr:sigma-70 family RNA polymerase sigma factor [Flavihumibacter sp. UBA7668]
MSSDNYYTDTELFQQLTENQQQALSDLMNRYKFSLLCYFRKFTGKEELIKEAFLDTMYAVWEQRMEVAEKEDPLRWMFRIAHNKVCNKLRAEKRFIFSPLDSLSIPPHTKLNGELELEAKELERRVEKAVELLTPHEQLVFHLSKQQGCSTSEIAARLNVSENTVRNQLSSSLKKIRSYLKDSFFNLFI